MFDFDSFGANYTRYVDWDGDHPGQRFEQAAGRRAFRRRNGGRVNAVGPDLSRSRGEHEEQAAAGGTEEHRKRATHHRQRVCTRTELDKFLANE